MWRVLRPTSKPGTTYLACISRVRDAALKGRLELVEGNIVDASNEFVAAAEAARLHTLSVSNNVGGQVTAQEMSDVYTHRMARIGAPGRPIYDELLAAPLHGRCPLCGHRTVSTLDHHLPKAHFPALAVAPANLIPACGDCNKAKLNAVPANSTEQTLHPYFDNVEDEAWLYADVVEAAPAALRFLVKPPNGWSNNLAARVRHHFTSFSLAYLYASHAAEEILNIRYYLTQLHVKAGAAGVKAHLSETADSCKQARVNSWQTATFRALAESDWFCDGGFT